MQLDPWVPLLETDSTQRRSEPESPTPHYTDGKTGQGHIQERAGPQIRDSWPLCPKLLSPLHTLCLSSGKDRGSAKKAVARA